MASTSRTARNKSRPLTLGLAAFAKISAIEGVRLSPESRKMFAEFERKGLSDQQRREAIMTKHAGKAKKA